MVHFLLQDTSPAQFALLRLLGAHHRICVVGDDDQSIFSFSGADPSNFLHFFDFFSQHKAAQLPASEANGDHANGTDALAAPGSALCAMAKDLPAPGLRTQGMPGAALQSCGSYVPETQLAPEPGSQKHSKCIGGAANSLECGMHNGAASAWPAPAPAFQPGAQAHAHDGALQPLTAARSASQDHAQTKRAAAAGASRAFEPAHTSQHHSQQQPHSPHVVCVTLGTNYRCPRSVVQAASALIQYNSGRLQKQLVAHSEYGAFCIQTHAAGRPSCTRVY